MLTPSRRPSPALSQSSKPKMTIVNQMVSGQSWMSVSCKLPSRVFHVVCWVLQAIALTWWRLLRHCCSFSHVLSVSMVELQAGLMRVMIKPMRTL